MSKRTKRLRRKFKEVARKRIAVGARVSRVAIPLVSFAAGVLYGPVASAAVTALSHYPHQWQETTAARGQGLHGRDARHEGRVHAQRTTVHSLYAGLGGSTVALAVGGLGAGATGLLGQSQLGLGSGAGLVPGLSNPLVTAPTPTVFPGGLTVSQVAPIAKSAGTIPTVLPGGLTSTQLITATQGSFAADAAFAAAVPSTTASLPLVSSASKLLSMETLTTGGGLVKSGLEIYDKYKAKVPVDLPDVPSGLPFPGFPGGDSGGGDSGKGLTLDQTAPSGTSDFGKLALILGGAYLLSKAA